MHSPSSKEETKGNGEKGQFYSNRSSVVVRVILSSCQRVVEALGEQANLQQEAKGRVHTISRLKVSLRSRLVMGRLVHIEDPVPPCVAK